MFRWFKKSKQIPPQVTSTQPKLNLDQILESHRSRKLKGGNVRYKPSIEMVSTLLKDHDSEASLLLRQLFAAIFKDESSFLEHSLEKLTSYHSHLQWKQLDASFRSEASQNIGWQHTNHFMQIVETTQSISILKCLTMWPDGYVREIAVRRLQEQSDQSVLPILFLRVNDWISAISKSARQSILSICEKCSLEDLQKSIPSFTHLAHCGRHDLGPFEHALVSVFFKRLQESRIADILHSAEETPNKRAAAELLWRQSHNLAESTYRKLLTAEDPFIRFKTRKEHLPQLSLDEQERLVIDLPTTRWTPAKIERLRTLERTQSKHFHIALHEALLDNSLAVRQFGRFFLKKSENIDFEQFYLEKLQLGVPLKNYHTALRGLHEVAPNTALPFIDKGLDSKNVNLQACCLYLLDEKSVHILTERIVHFLESNIPQLSRAAYHVAKKLNRPDLFFELIPTAKTPQIRKYALSLTFSGDRWSQIDYALRLITNKDPDIQKRAMDTVFRFYQKRAKYWDRPTEAQKSRVLANLANAKLCLSEHALREIEFTLK